MWAIHIAPKKYIITLKKNKTEKSISQEVRLKTTHETRNCFKEKINIEDLMSQKLIIVCTVWNYNSY